MRRRSWSVLSGLLLVGLLMPATASAAGPTITRFSPTSGPLGTRVTISGTGLAGATSVRFNGKAATIAANTATSLRAKVPAGAGTGRIRVTTPGGTATSAASFRVTLGILVAPASASSGASLEVSGAGFTRRGRVDLKFDTTRLRTITADAKGTFSKVALVVPTAAHAGAHTIAALDRTTSKSTTRPVTVSRDWPQFRHDPAPSGYASAETTISAANVDDLAVAWTGDTGSKDNYSSPAVANGVVYVGSQDGKLYAFKVGCNSGGGTCTPLWTGTTGDMITSSPAVANRVVYIGSRDGRLYAFKVGCNTGGGACTPLWTGATGAWVDSSPAVANGVVYVGSMDRKLYAFAVGCASGGGTCTPLWTGATGGNVNSSPAVADGVVYLVSGDGKLYAGSLGGH
jgi:hypothetical protein